MLQDVDVNQARPLDVRYCKTCVGRSLGKDNLAWKDHSPICKISIYQWIPFKLNLSETPTCLERPHFLDIKDDHSRQVSLYTLKALGRISKLLIYPGSVLESTRSVLTLGIAMRQLLKLGQIWYLDIL